MSPEALKTGCFRPDIFPCRKGRDFIFFILKLGLPFSQIFQFHQRAGTSMDLNIYNSLFLAGIVQGFIFVGVVLLSTKYKSRSSYFLTALIFALSLGNLNYFLSDAGIITVDQLYLYLYLPLASAIAPLLYLYVRTFLYPAKPVTRGEKLLFLPFLIFLLLTLIFRIGKLMGVERPGFDTFFGYILTLHEIFSITYTFSILLILLITIRRYDVQQQNYGPTTVKARLNWLKVTLTLLFILTFIWGFLAYKNIFVPEVFTSFYLLWLGISVLIYWLGHVGIYQFGILEERKKIRAHSVKNKKTKPSGALRNEHIVALEKLLQEDKIYLDPGLTLETVAKRLNLSTSHLSRVLNAELQTNFNEYLNSFRINEAKNYLRNPDFSKYTIVAIGLEAGFNSKSAFFNVFKKTTGQTPSEYKKEHLPST